ncbi:beta-ketoacyl synthase N-terminal-like domain-containing protein [Paenibacillus sp. FJAT-26967]|uniref:beta-ketoacyl synthase N-terminal-like domain-containing protein n=1 Tax=Paenibacillus sp. FJAT-26967 TaxID=1729690 RepID=UPI0008392501|nr:beta-ketoacyl synthase N-terminal-like domain-containing protein [Paenibacillus sp. FJAT-26967]
MEPVYITGAGCLTAPGFRSLAEMLGGGLSPERENKSLRIEDVPEAPPTLKRFKRQSRAVQLATLVTGEALREAGIPFPCTDGDKIAMVVGTDDANLDAIYRLNQEAEAYGVNNTSPGLFPDTVLNVTAGQTAIYYGLSGPNVTISSGGATSVRSLQYAVDLLASENVSHVVVCAVHLAVPEIFRENLRHQAHIETVASLLLSKQPLSGTCIRLSMKTRVNESRADIIEIEDEELIAFAALLLKENDGARPCRFKIGSVADRQYTVELDNDILTEDA